MARGRDALGGQRYRALTVAIPKTKVTTSRTQKLENSLPHELRNRLEDICDGDRRTLSES